MVIVNQSEYDYDVFLSYSRAMEWPVWVENHFLPIFRHWLSAELGYEARIFVDIQTESGISWPQKLDRSLAKSAVLVPLWSRNYFSSDWCTRELSLMRAREVHYNFRSISNPYGLIVPAIIHDGRELPWDIREIQHINLAPYVNIRMAKDSVAAENLSELIRDWVPDIKTAISMAPPCAENINSLDCETFVQQFKESAPKQSIVPRFF